ncbi:hypothetical protein GCM10010360_51300 [Streptomyces nogalater]
MPGGPRTREPGLKVRGRRGLVSRAEREGVYCGLHGGEAGVARAGEEIDVHGLIPCEVGQVPDAQDLGETQDDLKAGCLQPASLDGFDPLSGPAHKSAELVAGETASCAKNLEPLAECQGVGVRVRGSVRWHGLALHSEQVALPE